MSNDFEARERRSRSIWLHVAAIIAVAIPIVIVAWRVVLDPIIDIGRDLYVPDQLAHGARLYRDLRYNYPPLAPYGAAAFFRLAGTSLSSYFVLNLSIAILAATAVWLATRAAFDRLSATVATLLFVTLCLAGTSTYTASFLVPYAQAATLGVAAMMLFIGALVASLNRNSQRLLALALFAGSVGAWTKQEYALAFVVTIAATFFLQRQTRWAIVAAAAANGAVLFLLHLFFRDPRPGHHWITDNVLTSSLLSGENAKRFYAMVSGSGELVKNATLITFGLALLSLLVLIVRWLEADARGARGFLLLAALSIVEYLLAALFFRPWPLIQLAAILVLLKRDRSSPLLPLFLFATTISFRILWQNTPDWYGFALILPTLVTATGALLVELPRRGVYSRKAALLFLPIFCVIGWRGVMREVAVYRMTNATATSQLGSYRDPVPGRAAVISDLSARIRKSGARSLVVFPEGVSLNAFSSVPSPISDYLFTPIESGSTAAETRILGELSAHPPDLIVITPRDVGEFGSRGFGADYDQRIAAFVRDRYEIVGRWDREGYFVFRRVR